MNAPTNIQVINGPDGKPAFVVLPYADYVARTVSDKGLTPHEVVSRVVRDEVTPARAWREYLGLTQAEVAARLGVSQPTYAEQEGGELRLRKATKEKIAAALGITLEQLDV
jgi:DNA-binding XRE family transcriptional regulator